MYSLSIEKEYLHFSSAHFVIFSESEREPLHGHNYHVSVFIEGHHVKDGKLIELDLVKKVLKEMCDELDHKTLLPQFNPNLLVFPNDDTYSVTFNNRTFYLPFDDCILLPIKNTTMENLSEYISYEFLKRFQLKDIHKFVVSVQETLGQKGSYTMNQEHIESIR